MGKGRKSERKEVQDYLATGERRKETGIRKWEEEEKVKGRKAGLPGFRKGSRKQEEGREGGSEEK